MFYLAIAEQGKRAGVSLIDSELFVLEWSVAETRYDRIKVSERCAWFASSTEYLLCAHALENLLDAMSSRDCMSSGPGSLSNLGTFSS